MVAADRARGTTYASWGVVLSGGVRVAVVSLPASQPARQVASQAVSQPPSQPASQPSTQPASQPASQPAMSRWEHVPRGGTDEGAGSATGHAVHCAPIDQGVLANGSGTAKKLARNLPYEKVMPECLQVSCPTKKYENRLASFLQPVLGPKSACKFLASFLQVSSNLFSAQIVLASFEQVSSNLFWAQLVLASFLQVSCKFRATVFGLKT